MRIGNEGWTSFSSNTAGADSTHKNDASGQQSDPNSAGEFAVRNRPSELNEQGPNESGAHDQKINGEAGKHFSEQKTDTDGSAPSTRTKRDAEINLNPNPKPSTLETLQPPSATQERFEAQDRQYGPLKIGDIEVDRKTLFDLNATIDGRPVRPEDTDKPRVDPTWANKLQVDAGKLVESSGRMIPSLEQRDAASDFVYDLATQRATTERSVIAPSSSPSDSEVTLKTLMDHQQRVSKDAQMAVTNGPAWLDVSRSNTDHKINTTLRMFGLYSGIKGLVHGVKNKDYKDAALQGGAVATDVVPELLTKGISSASKKAFENGEMLWNKFGKTGASRLIKGVNVVGNAAGAGLDTYQFIDSLLKAKDAKTPEEKKDHYVSAGFSATNIALSVAATGMYFFAPAAAAAMALPLVAIGGLLIAGQQVYSAVRTVDEIKKYVPLSGWDRLEIGLSKFMGGPVPEKYASKYHTNKSISDHFTGLVKSAETRLNGELRDTTEVIVIGTAKTEPKTISVLRSRAGAYGFPRRETQTVGASTTNSGDDNFDLSDGIKEDFSNRPDIRVIHGESGPNKAVRFETGGGNDKIIGVKDRPNHFIGEDGKKIFIGGDKDDVFVIQAKEHRSGGEFYGGAGNDRLVVQSTPAEHVTVDLRPGESGHGKLSIGNRESAFSEYKLHSIETVQTGGGSVTKVIGSDGSDIIHAQGTDNVDAGDGNDGIVIGETASGEFSGGKGNDLYVIESGTGAVTLRDDPSDTTQDSLVELKWKSGQIQSFRVEGTSVIIQCQTSTGEPGRTITLADVYQEKDGKYVLRNDKWTLKTEDGYLLKILMPQSRPVNASPSKLQVTAVWVGAADRGGAGYDIPIGGDNSVVGFNKSNSPAELRLEYRSGDIKMPAEWHKSPAIKWQNGGIPEKDNVVVKFGDGRSLNLNGIPRDPNWQIRLVTQDGVNYLVKSPALNRNEFMVREGGDSQITQRTNVIRSHSLPAGRYTVEVDPDADVIVLRGTKEDHEIDLADGGNFELESSQLSTKWRLDAGGVDFEADEIQLFSGNMLRIGKKTWVRLPSSHQGADVINGLGEIVYSIPPSSS
ncbi:hypothetical protein ACVHYJ_17590 [Burkholderia pyrrocinia]